MDVVNRIGLVLVGLVLVVAGGAGLAASVGALVVPEPGELVTPAVQAVDEASETAVSLAVGVGMLVALLGVLIVVGELRPTKDRSEGQVALPAQRGTTSLSTSALEGALADDAERQHGVLGARARLRRAPPDAQLQLRLDVAADADLAAVRRQVDDVVGRACRTLAIDGIDTEVRLRLSARPDRVR